MVDAVVIRAFRLGSCRRVFARGPAECEVPFEEVVVKGCGSVVGGWAGGEFGGFADYEVIS